MTMRDIVAELCFQSKWTGQCGVSKVFDFVQTLDRSRHAKFISSAKNIRTRSREPSRIPVKKLQRVLQKSRKVRKYVRRTLRKNFPQSSGIHYVTHAAFQRQYMYGYSCTYRNKYLRRRNTVSRTWFRADRTKCFTASRNLCNFHSAVVTPRVVHEYSRI